MLTFLGIPAVTANVTNTVALCPGYFGGTLAQWNDLRGQKNRLWLIVPAGIVGGVVGGYLLLQTGERLFRELVPYLILLASALLAIQDPVRAWLVRRMGEGHGARLEKLAWLPVGLASVYGGYFGAGLSVIVLSALGLTLEDSLTRLNALKQAVAFSVNVAAAIFFLFSGQVIWSAGAGDGSRRIDRRDIGRQARGSHQTIHAALDSCRHRRGHFHYLFRARVIYFSPRFSIIAYRLYHLLGQVTL